MHLTPEILAATYDWLRALPPFRRWKLPPADEVEFAVTSSERSHGDCLVIGDRIRIRVSHRTMSYPSVLARVMAHEMCHVYADKRGEEETHGRLWKKAAAQVCKEHGYDPKEF